jgi:hypothetical protein
MVTNDIRPFFFIIFIFRQPSYRKCFHYGKFWYFSLLYHFSGEERCEYGNERSTSIKSGEFVGCLMNINFSKRLDLMIFWTRYIIYKKNDNLMKGKIIKHMQILNGLCLNTWLFNRKDNKLTHWFYNALLDGRNAAYNGQVLMAFLLKWTQLFLEV